MNHRLQAVLDIALPERCVLCGRPLLGCRAGDFALCRYCCGDLEWLGEPRCCSCGAPLVSEQQTCLDCRERCHGFDLHRSAFGYDFRVAELLHCFKADGIASLARFCAQALLKLYHQRCDGALLVPVPGHPSAIRRRGWDQTHRICRCMRQADGVAVCAALCRDRTRHQKELGLLERQQNLRGRIRLAVDPALIAGRSVALIDDVYTTGATLDACCEALRPAGVVSIYAFTVAMDL